MLTDKFPVEVEFNLTQEKVVRQRLEAEEEVQEPHSYLVNGEWMKTLPPPPYVNGGTKVIELFTTPRRQQPCITDFEQLLGDYWDLAYEEGRLQLSNGDAANEVLNKLRQLVKSPEPCQKCAELRREIEVVGGFCEMPCGHSSDAAYTLDEGKHIACRECEKDALQTKVTELKALSVTNTSPTINALTLYKEETENG